MKSDISIENMEETIRKMSLYNENLRNEFKSIVEGSSKKIASNAKSNVNAKFRPKTGKLYRAIKPKQFDKNGPAATVLPRKAPHRHLAEYGTQPRRHKSGKSVGSMPARPFMKPAADSERPNYEREVRKLVDKVVTI
jgi:HK97 gp10 family phage protein